MNAQKKTSPFRRNEWRILACVLLLAVLFGWTQLQGVFGVTMHKDLTRSGAYTLSKSTLDFLKTIDEDVELLLIVGDDQGDLRTEEILGHYEATNSHISARDITVTQAAYYTSTQAEEGNLIVTNGEYIVTIPYDQLYQMEYEAGTYNQTLSKYDFAAENRVNRAIANVTMDLPIVYRLLGHSETALESGMESIMIDQDYHMKDLYLAELGSIPEDCSMILCNVPQVDFSQVEADLLIEYLDNGGALFLVTDYRYDIGEQIERVAEHVGLSAVKGIIIEGDTDYMFRAEYPYYLRPEYADKSGITSSLWSDEPKPEKPVIAVAHGIDFMQREGYTQSALWKTSDQAFIKENALKDGVMTYTEGDKKGAFNVAAVSEGQNGAKMFWLPASQCLLDAIDDLVSGANYNTMNLVVRWMHGDRTRLDVAYVEPASLLTPEMPMDPTWPSIALILLLPVVILLAGSIVCISRRRKSVSQRTE